MTTPTNNERLLVLNEVASVMLTITRLLERAMRVNGVADQPLKGKVGDMPSTQVRSSLNQAANLARTCGADIHDTKATLHRWVKARYGSDRPTVADAARFAVFVRTRVLREMSALAQTQAVRADAPAKKAKAAPVAKAVSQPVALNSQAQAVKAGNVLRDARGRILPREFADVLQS